MDRFAWQVALGEMRGAPASLRAWLSAGAAFDPLPAPRPQEWLSIHEEHPQPFDEYIRTATRPTSAERIIYLQPVDALPGLSDECLSTLAGFAGAFFGLDVRVLPPLLLELAELTTRSAPDTGTRQVLAGDILRRLSAGKPTDAFCVVGITAHDLFPHPIVSFAFGEASATRRVGVCSVARYGPPFCRDAPGAERGAMRRRCCRVIAHEIGHMAGIGHCVYFRCLMNGSSSFAESERRPLHVCPIDLRKLEWLFGFDTAERYGRLQQFWSDAGDQQESAWMADRLRAWTTSASAAAP